MKQQQQQSTVKWPTHTHTYRHIHESSAPFIEVLLGTLRNEQASVVVARVRASLRRRRSRSAAASVTVSVG